VDYPYGNESCRRRRQPGAAGVCMLSERPKALYVGWLLTVRLAGQRVREGYLALRMRRRANAGKSTCINAPWHRVARRGMQAHASPSSRQTTRVTYRSSAGAGRRYKVA